LIDWGKVGGRKVTKGTSGVINSSGVQGESTFDKDGRLLIEIITSYMAAVIQLPAETASLLESDIAGN
jgi:hypothetical protein